MKGTWMSKGVDSVKRTPGAEKRTAYPSAAFVY